MYYDISEATHNSTTYQANETVAWWQIADWQGDESDAVSYWYNRASGITLLTTPLVYMLFSECFKWDRKQEWLRRLYIIGLKHLRHVDGKWGVILKILSYFMHYVISFIWVYIYVPLHDLYYGFINLLCCKWQEEEVALRRIYQLPEQFAEAIPIFVTAVIFFKSNAKLLSPLGFIYGCASMIFSLGSILLGIVKGLRAMIKNDPWS